MQRMSFKIYAQAQSPATDGKRGESELAPVPGASTDTQAEYSSQLNWGLVH